MAMAFLGIVILVQFLQFVEFGSGQLPCSNYFRYIHDDSTHEILGRIEIPAPPKGIVVHLWVNLKIAAILPSKYAGRLELARSKKESIDAIMQGKSLIYHLHFPLQSTIPVVARIIFNNEEYCREQQIIGTLVTSIILEHTLSPPMTIHIPKNLPALLLTRQQIQSSLENSNSISTSNPDTAWMSTTILPFESIKTMDKNCGRARTDNVNFLIAGAEKSLPGQWPWLVAIFLMQDKLEFRCSGSLIGNKHVLTAAHCLVVNDTEVSVSALSVSLGRYRLGDWQEEGSVNLGVSKYKFYLDDDRKDDESDIAMIVLTETVTFSSVIQPVCLWSGPVELERIIGRTGYVTGWGQDEKGTLHTVEPRVIHVPIVSQEDCLRSNVDFIVITSNRTFCAGARDGSGPCNGDSGSGLVIRDLNTGQFHLRGIVSLSLWDVDTKSCDLSQYVVYTDVAQYLDWIREEIAN